MNIYLHLNGKDVGPYSVTDIMSMYQAGSVDAATYAYAEGAADYTTLDNLVPAPAMNDAQMPAYQFQPHVQQVTSPSTAKCFKIAGSLFMCGGIVLSFIHPIFFLALIAGFGLFVVGRFYE